MSRKMTPLFYVSAFLGSLDFYMQSMFPLKYLYDETLPDPTGLPQNYQLAITMKRVMLNLPLLEEGEKKDLYKVSTEDVGKLTRLTLAESQEWSKIAIQMIDMAMSHPDTDTIARFAAELMKKE